MKVVPLLILMVFSLLCGGLRDRFNKPSPPQPPPTPMIVEPTPNGNSYTRPANGMSRTISGGVLNEKAKLLPLPAYPPAARAVKASGTVDVQVLVDEEGKVVSATATSGHPLLRSAAVQAARKAKFEPIILSGERHPVSGVIKYEFKP